MSNVTFSANVNWSGGVQSVATSGNHQFIIDEPASLGGADKGANPVEYLLGSLGGCLNVLIAAFAPQHGVELKSVATRVEGDINPDGFQGKADVRTGFQEIRYQVDIVSDSPAESVARLLAHAQRVCPVKDTLTGVPVLSLTPAAAAS